MKKVLNSLVIVFLIITVLTLSACSDDKSGTFYPTVKEMVVNLEKNGYKTQFSLGERNSEGRGYVVDSLAATKDGDYIYFYWIEDAAHCKVYYDKLQELHPDCANFISIENDEKFGNIVYCGTSDAIDAAGIIVVNVNVKI